MTRRRVMTIAAVLIAVVSLLTLIRIMSQRTPPVGLIDGRLRDCPNTPNCVCTGASSVNGRIEPISLNGLSAAESMDRITRILSGWPRVRIVQADDRYLHAEFTSLLFRFVDDVEFLIDEKGGQLHFRSASRLGHSDLGVNRARMEKFRQLFERG